MNVKLFEGGIVPTRAHEDDAGLDLYTPGDVVIPAGGFVKVDTKVGIELPSKTVGFIKSRSSLMKIGLTTDGTIDVGYTGEIGVMLFNHSDEAVRLRAGSKIAQLVVCNIEIPKIKIVEDFGKTSRGDAGWGSSGK